MDKECLENAIDTNDEFVWEYPKIEGNLKYHDSFGSENIDEESDAIIETLERFDASCDLTATQGPSITRIFLSPIGNTRVSSVLRLEDDLSVAIGKPISLKMENGRLVLELPRKHRDSFYFGDLVKTEEFKSAGKTALAIGVDVEKNPIIYDLKDAVHILVAGQTGSGKSVLLHNFILSLLMKNTSSEIRLRMIDLKQTEFYMYDGIPFVQVVNNIRRASTLLHDMCSEMERRYQKIKESSCRDIDEYNSMHKDSPMVREVVIIDELADLMNQCGKSVETPIASLAQKARACGIHLIIATKSLVRTVVTGLIKQNIPTRICLSVKDNVASRVAIDTTGAEKLTGKGDMLFLANGASSPVRLQGGYVSLVEICNIVCHFLQEIVREMKFYKEKEAKIQEQTNTLPAQNQQQNYNNNPPVQSYSYYQPPVQSYSYYQQPVQNYNTAQQPYNYYYNQNYNSDQDYTIPQYARPYPAKKSCLCGIVSIVCGFLGIFFWALGVSGIVFGITGAVNRNENSVPAVFGVIISILGLIWPILAYMLIKFTV